MSSDMNTKKRAHAIDEPKYARAYRITNPSDRRKVTVYTAKWCDVCKKQVPMIQTLAQMYGFTVELVDVDSEDLDVQKRAQYIRFVPYIEYLGLEISFSELMDVIKETGGAGVG